MNNPAPQQASDDLYDILMMEYASGVLDSTLSLLVATHLTLSATGRRHVASYEALGGALIAECCEPVAMESECLKAVLSQLDGCADDAECAEETAAHDFGCGLLPKSLQRYMREHACHARKWRRARHGVRVMAVPLPAPEARRAMLVRAGLGSPLPRHRMTTREYTLVLRGALRDHQQGRYGAGDLLIIETAEPQRPVAQGAEGCVCLVIADGPASSHSWLSALFPFRW